MGLLKCNPTSTERQSCVTAVCSGTSRVMVYRIKYSKELLSTELWGLFEGGAI